MENSKRQRYKVSPFWQDEVNEVWLRYHQADLHLNYSQVHSQGQVQVHFTCIGTL
jgi:hypothetical protein